MLNISETLKENIINDINQSDFSDIELAKELILLIFSYNDKRVDLESKYYGQLRTFVKDLLLKHNIDVKFGWNSMTSDMIMLVTASYYIESVKVIK